MGFQIGCFLHALQNTISWKCIIFLLVMLTHQVSIFYSFCMVEIWVTIFIGDKDAQSEVFLQICFFYMYNTELTACRDYTVSWRTVKAFCSLPSLVKPLFYWSCLFFISLKKRAETENCFMIALYDTDLYLHLRTLAERQKATRERQSANLLKHTHTWANKKSVSAFF